MLITKFAKRRRTKSSDCVDWLHSLTSFLAVARVPIASRDGTEKEQMGSIADTRSQFKLTDNKRSRVKREELAMDTVDIAFGVVGIVLMIVPFVFLPYLMRHSVGNPESSGDNAPFG